MIFLELTQAQWQDVGISLIILLAAIYPGRWFINRLLLPILRRIISRTKTNFDDILLESVSGPAYWLLVIWSAQFAFTRLDFIQSFLNINFADVYFVLYLLFVYSAALRITSNLAKWYSGELAESSDTQIGRQLMPFVSRIALIIISIIASIILLDHFNVEVSGLVATLGIGSLAIALAAQAALSDIISGFMIMIDRPFRVGDRIEIEELNTWGDVIDIGLRSSRIRTRDNRMVIVPNSIIGKSLIVNYSYPDSQYRIQIEVPISYDADVAKVRKTIVDAVSKVDGVLSDHPVEALFLHFGEDAQIFRVRWWLESYEDTRRMFDRVNSAIITALEKEGIEIAITQYKIFHKIDNEDAAQISKVLKSSK